MSERKDREDRSTERRPAEGVRIIGADEAQAALDAGQAAGRRGDDELRFGDVPPAPQGPRPPHRFPLPDSVDPAAAVPRPPVAAPVRSEERPGGLRTTRPVSAGEAHDSRPWHERGRPVEEPSNETSGAAEAESAEAVTPPAVAGANLADTDQVPIVEAPAAEVPEADVKGPSWWPSVTASSTPGTYEAVFNEPTGNHPSFVLPSFAAPEAPSTSPAGAPEAGEPSSENPVESWAERVRRTSRYLGADPVADPEAQIARPWNSPTPPPPSQSDAASLPFAPSASLGRRYDWEAAGVVDSDPAVGDEPPVAAAPAASSSPGPDAGPNPGAAGYDEAVTAEHAWTEHAWSDPAPAADAGHPPEADLSNPGLLAEPYREAAGDPVPKDEGITMSGGTELPHWTDPPTGEVPRILPDDGVQDDDDLEAWEALGSQGVRWRDESDDWSDLGQLEDLGSEDTRVGALDPSRAEHSDLYSFDAEFDRLEEERSGSHAVIGRGGEEATGDDFGQYRPEPERISSSVRSSARAAGRAPTRGRANGIPADVESSGGRNLGSAVAVGAILLIILGIAYAAGSKGLLVLSAIVVLACAVEAYGMLQRSGFRPATLLGLVSTVGIMFAAYWRGVEAIPLIAVLVFAATMLWYLFRIVEARPLANVAVTTMTFLWVGVLGAFGPALLRDSHGKGLFLGAVLPAVAADIVAYVVGSRVGSRQLAPHVSPGKTIEGLMAGALAAIVVGAIVGREITPWGGVKHGLLLGVMVAIVAPIGDLFESMIKRDLSVKDSGTALPGHGGLLDRFDSILLVLPATYYLAILFNIAH